jgi:thiol:disulfide interchange protein DsbA
MNRALASLLALVVAAVASLPAAGAPFEEPKHYQTVAGAKAPAADSRIEVIEFFSWTCPHCMRFEPYLHKWLQAKPADVDFVKIPVVPDPPTKTESSFVNQAKAYYALEGMGQLARLSDEFFKAIIDQRQRLNDEPSITTFVSRFGVDAEAFRQAFNSFEVDGKVRRAYQLAKDYQINSWPRMVVDGRYRSGEVESYQQMADLTTFLVEQARRLRKPAG